MNIIFVGGVIASIIAFIFIIWAVVEEVRWAKKDSRKPFHTAKGDWHF